MEPITTSKVIDLAPHLRRDRRRELVRIALSLWTQYLSLGALLLYGLLRLTVCPGMPLGSYSGPLALLWPVSYILLLASYLSGTFLAATPPGEGTPLR